MTPTVRVADLTGLMKDNHVSSVLPGVESVADAALWINADARPFFEKSVISALCDAFPDLKPILWVIGSGRGNSEQLQDYHRGFGFKAADLQYLQRVDIARGDRLKKTYSDVVWLTSELHALTAERLSQTSPGISVALSFIPGTDHNGYRWADAVTGLLWQSMLRTTQSPLNLDLLNASIMAYVRTTTDMDGVAMILAADVDTKPSLLGFGASITINHALQSLSARFDVLSEDVGKRLLLRNQLTLMGNS